MNLRSRRVVRIVLIGTLALGGAVSGAVRPSRAQVTLVWADSYGLLRFGFDAMAEEVGAIFEDAGVDVEWRKSVDPPDESSILIVINVSPSSSTNWGLREHAMGVMAKRSGPELNRVVHIFFRNILRTLGLKYEKRRLPKAGEIAMLSRALARVISHELVHALSPEAPHTDTGLMQRRLTRAYLRDNRYLRLSVETQHALYARLHRGSKGKMSSP